MMQKEKWICIPHQLRRREPGEMCTDAPFGGHVGPGVQFDGALFGHDPTISLEAAKGKKYELYSDETAHPAMIACTPLCGP
jgi:hypothetical protein